MHEKRLVDRLESYWNRLRKDAAYPSAQQFHQGAIDDMWPSCLWLEIQNNPSKKNAIYTYRHMGSSIVEAYGQDLTDNYVNVHMHNFPGWQVLNCLDEIFENPKPTQSHGNFVNSKDQVIKYRACAMPFGKDNHITHMLVGLSWKAFS